MELASPNGAETSGQTLSKEDAASLETLAPLFAAIPTTCIETIGGDPNTALRLSFQIKVF